MTFLHLTVFECLLIVANSACVAKCDDSVARTPDEVATLNLVVREILGRLDEKDSQLKEQSRQLKEQSNLLEELREKLDDQQTIIDNQNKRLRHLEADANNAKHRSISKEDVSGYAVYDDSDKKDVDVAEVKKDDVVEYGHVATGPQNPNTESVKRTGNPLFRKDISVSGNTYIGIIIDI